MLLLSSLDVIARGTSSAVYAASRRVLGDELQLPCPCVILIDLLHQQLDNGTPLFLRLHQCCNLSFQDASQFGKMFLNAPLPSLGSSDGRPPG